MFSLRTLEALLLFSVFNVAVKKKDYFDSRVSFVVSLPLVSQLIGSILSHFYCSVGQGQKYKTQSNQLFMLTGKT